MKRTATILAASALSALALGAAANGGIKITSFDVGRPLGVRTPVFADSAASSKFQRSAMLDCAPLGRQRGEMRAAAADTAGVLHIEADAAGATLRHEVSTRLMAAHFLKGKLKVTSALPYSVAADGKKLGVKETREDSVTAASVKTYPLTLEPERIAEISIALLTSGEDKAEPSVSVEFLPDEEFEDVVLKSGADLAPRFSIATTAEGQRAAATSMSPDGNYLLIDWTEQYKDGSTRKWTELTDLRAGRPLIAEMGNRAFWMPKGTRLGYTVKTGDGYTLMVTDVPSMSTSVFASGLPTADFTISPDESCMVFTQAAEHKEESGIMRRVLSPDDRIPGNRARNYLALHDFATGMTQTLVSGGPTTHLQGFSPDSKKVLYSVTAEAPDNYPFYFNSLVELDLASLRTDTLVSRDGSVAGGIYSPDGRQLFIVGGAGAFGGIGAAQGEKHPMPNDFDVQGYILDIATKKATPVTRDFDPTIAGTPVWNAADGCVYFRAQEGFYCYIWQFDPKSGKFRKMETTPDFAAGFSMGERAREIAYTGQGYDHAGGVYLVNARSGKGSILYDPMKEMLDEIDWGTSQPWQFTASDGTVIDGTVTLPPDFNPEKKYPAIVYYYSGTTPSIRAMNNPYTPQLFASRDYVVYVINPSGTIGYGQEFSARHVNAWGKRTAEDIIEGTKEFCRQHPFVDKDRIGCIGASYGGFMTQYLQTQTDIFAAAVSHAGISNVTSYWGEGFWGYSYNSVAAAKSYPWTDPDLFTKQGSLFNADKIHTPLLLLHGTKDTNVPIGESIQLFNALKILGREVEFITVEDTDHIVLDYDKRVVWHATIMAWFAKWLQDDSRWWDALYGN